MGSPAERIGVGNLVGEMMRPRLPDEDRYEIRRQQRDQYLKAVGETLARFGIVDSDNPKITRTPPVNIDADGIPVDVQLVQYKSDLTQYGETRRRLNTSVSAQPLGDENRHILFSVNQSFTVQGEQAFNGHTVVLGINGIATDRDHENALLTANFISHELAAREENKSSSITG